VFSFAYSTNTNINYIQLFQNSYANIKSNMVQ